MLFSEPYHFSIRYTSPVLRGIRRGSDFSDLVQITRDCLRVIVC